MALNISAGLAPTGGGGWETHDAQYGKGGFRSVADVAARDAITSLRRSAGMIVHTQATGAFYILGPGLTNADWVQVQLGVTAGNGLTGTSILSVLANGGTINVSASGIKVATGGIANNEIAAAAAILVSKLANGTSRQQIRTNNAGNGVEWFSPPGLVVASDLTDASATKNISDGSQYTLPTLTLSAVRTITLGTSGSPEVDEIVEFIVFSQNFNFVLNNGGPNGGTLYTVASGTSRIVHASWNGTDWRPAGKGRLSL